MFTTPKHYSHKVRHRYGEIRFLIEIQTSDSIVYINQNQEDQIDYGKANQHHSQGFFPFEIML